MNAKRTFTPAETESVAKQLCIRWDRFDLEQFRAGLRVELEHGAVNPATNVTNDDLLLTGKIALAHLTEFPDYYTRLAKMEATARRFWDSKRRKQSPPGSGKRSGPRT